MARTTKQKLATGDGAYLAYFIDESAPILKWRAKGEMSIEVEVEVLPPGTTGVWDSGKPDEA